MPRRGLNDRIIPACTCQGPMTLLFVLLLLVFLLGHCFFPPFCSVRTRTASRPPDAVCWHLSIPCSAEE